MDTPSAVEAEAALEQARKARRDTVDALRTPWWVWGAAGVVAALYTAAFDFGSTAQEAASLGMAVLVVGWVVAVRRSPRLAAATGAMHRSAAPSYAWLPVLLIALVFGLVQYAARPAVHHVLTGSGVPAWIRDHPHTVAAVPYAVLSIAGALVVNLIARGAIRRAGA